MTDYVLPDTPTGVDAEAWRVAVGAIRSFCRWHIAPSITEQVELDGPGGSSLLLPSLRVTDLQALVEDGTDLSLADLQWSRQGTVRRSYGCWTRKLRGIQVQMVHGYEEWPAELGAVARAMVSAGTGALATQLVSGPHQITYTPEAIAGGMVWNPLQESVLERYRLRAPS